MSFLTPLYLWVVLVYNSFYCQEDLQFCRGFGGIGGILRYQLDIRSFDELSDDGEIYEDSD